MKKILYTLAALLVTLSAAAQDPTNYFMEGNIDRTAMNPAFAPTRGYLKLPAIGGLLISTHSNLSLDDLLYPRNGKLITLLDPSISADEALTPLKGKDQLMNLNIKTSLLGFGAYLGDRRSFWSVDLSLRVEGSLQVPYELFHFVKTGQSAYIRNLGINMTSYAEAAFGLSVPINDRIVVGGRVKFLVGLLRTKMNFDRFDASLGEDRWYADATGSLEVSGPGLSIPTRIEEGREIYQLDDMDFDLDNLKPAGYGLGFDLGVTYNPLPELQVSAAVNDLGFISWRGTIAGQVNQNIAFEGAEITPENPSPDLDFDLDDLKFEKTVGKSSARALHYNINLGAEYQVLDHKISFGALYSMRKYDYHALHNLTASVNLHPVRWFGFTGSYSFINNHGNAVGLALNLNSSAVNFFVGSDVLLSKKTKQWIPAKQSNMNVTFGLAVPIGKYGARVPEFVKLSDNKRAWKFYKRQQQIDAQSAKLSAKLAGQTPEEQERTCRQLDKLSEQTLRLNDRFPAEGMALMTEAVEKQEAIAVRKEERKAMQQSLKGVKELSPEQRNLLEEAKKAVRHAELDARAATVHAVRYADKAAKKAKLLEKATRKEAEKAAKATERAAEKQAREAEREAARQAKAAEQQARAAAEAAAGQA